VSGKEKPKAQRRKRKNLFLFLLHRKGKRKGKGRLKSLLSSDIWKKEEEREALGKKKN